MTARKEPAIAADEPGDEALIAATASGDEAAFRILVDRYTGLIFSLAFRMRFSHAGAEDVVQETWLRVWRSAGDWQKEKGASVRTWICRIATNLCIDRLRKSGRELPEETAPERADESAGADSTVSGHETDRILRSAIMDLPARQRSALVLFHYEEMETADIAAVLKTSPKSVEGLLRRARRSLRRQLAGYEGVL